MSQNELPPPARLHFVLADDAKVGVVLRRGPTRWVQLYKWDTGTDVFTPGQWFKGRIYEKRCDLSPDGRLFIYFAAKHNETTNAETLAWLNELMSGNRSESTRYYTCSWTAVSRPPYFTALALWPKGDCWAGGGVFETNREVWLNHPAGLDLPHEDHLPTRLGVHTIVDAHGEDFPIVARRLRRHGWTQRQARTGDYRPGKAGFSTDRPEVWVKDRPRGNQTLVMEGSLHGYDWSDRFRVEGGSREPVELAHATWADWDQQGRLVYVSAGRVLAGEIRDGGLVETLLADLNDATPAEVRAPNWARRW